MRRLILIILISITGLYLDAQTNLDSLFTVWYDNSNSPEIRLVAIEEIMYSESNSLFYSNPDSLFVINQEELKLATHINNSYHIIRGLINKAAILKIKGENEESFKLYKRANKMAIEAKDNRALMYSYEGLADYHYTNNDLAKSYSNYMEAIDYAERINDTESKALYLLYLGYLNKSVGNEQKAIENFKASMELYLAVNLKQNSLFPLLELSKTYYKIGEKDSAKVYTNKCQELAKQSKDSVAYMEIIYLRNSRVNKDEGNYELAIKNGLKVLRMSNRLSKKLAHVNLADIYTANQDKANAIKHLNEAIALNKKDQIINYLFNVISFGEIYFDLNELDKALKYCSEGFQLAEEQKSNIHLEMACDCLYEIHQKKGNNKLALKYRNLALIYQDSLKIEDKSKALLNVSFNQEIILDSIAKAEEARLIQVAHEEEMATEAQQRNIAIGSGFLLLLIAGSVYSRLRLVKKSKALLQSEKDRSENLLLNILPADIAIELKEKGKAEARDYDMVSILFTDFKGFTEASAKLSAQDLVSEINTCFEAFDGIVGKYGIEKIKTIGDAYMAAGGLPSPSNDSVKNTIIVALEMQAFISKRKNKMEAAGKPAFEMRVGIHTGPVVAGIVGLKKFQYDIWGDAVNTASRMESSGEVGKVNISQATYEVLKSDSQFAFESRGKIEAKGKGEMEMYFAKLKKEKE